MTYSFRQSFSLYGMQVLLFENQCKFALVSMWWLAPGRVNPQTVVILEWK